MKSITKALIFVFCVSVLIGACGKEEPETPQSSDSILKGKVKTITEYNYEGTEINGVIQKTSLNHTSVIKYNVDGQITNEGSYTYLYNDKGKLIEKRISENEVFKYKYDEKGNILEGNFYFKDQIQDKEIYKTDALGRITETKYYNPDHSLRTTSYNKYDNLGNLVEVQFKESDGNIAGTITYKYDQNRNLIQENFNDNPPSSKDFRAKYEYLKFDQKGNWTEMLEYNSGSDYIDRLESIVEREIEYYQ